MEDSEIYSQIGEEGFERLVAIFYGQIRSDEILGPLYPKVDLEGAERRLRDFLVFRFGGPDRYITQRGHPRLRLRHSPFPIGTDARDRWTKLMGKALVEANFPDEVRGRLSVFFDETATFLLNRPGH